VNQFTFKESLQQTYEKTTKDLSETKSNQDILHEDTLGYQEMTTVASDDFLQLCLKQDG